MSYVIWYGLWGLLGTSLLLLGLHVWTHRDHDWHRPGTEEGRDG